MSNYVVSISREFGSGGRLIGKKLAASLGIPCYDRTLIQKTAEKSGLSPDFIARAEERARSRFHLNIAPIGRCVAEYHIPSDNMESRIIQMDRGRANYYNYYTGHTWGEMRRYDLTLNSSITGINGAVEMIAQLVRLRSAQLDQAPTQAP